MNIIRRLIEGFLIGERRWGCARFLFMLFALTFFAYLGHLAFDEYTIESIIRRWTDQSGILKLVPRGALWLFAVYIWDFRFVLVSFAALAAAWGVSARYLQDIFNVQNFWKALDYLLRTLYTIGFPKMTIDKGWIQPKNDSGHQHIRDIGGPGRVIVHPGNVVLFEHLDRPSKVRAEGTHFVSRFETVKRFVTDETEISTLNEQHGFVEETRATTKDGISVLIKDINYRYKLRAGHDFEDAVKRRPNNPNPYSVRAVYDMAYKRNVRLRPGTEDGTTELNPWHNQVNFAVDSAITKYIQERVFDDIFAPRFPEEPRQAITDRIFDKIVRERIRNNGAELLWWDIGHFSVESKAVSRQLVESWSTKWKGLADVKLAFGEAKRLEYLERGRTEAQAEMLKAIVEALQGVELLEDSKENIEKLIIARVAQILDGLNDNGDSSPSRRLPPPSS